MASNNYAEVITDRAKAQSVLNRLETLAGEGSCFKVLQFNPNSDLFEISCDRVSNMPPLPDVESGGVTVQGANAKSDWSKHKETLQAIDFGNGHVGLMYESNDRAYMVIPDTNGLKEINAPHICPKCMTGFGCQEDPCTLAYESTCPGCSSPASEYQDRDRA